MAGLSLKHPFVATLLLAIFYAGLPVRAHATHSWGGYHWARTANPFSLKLGNNVSSTWKPYLDTTASDWNSVPAALFPAPAIMPADVLDLVIVAGGTKAKPCKATSGRVEVCSASYGFTGWLGIAQISISGSHITAGTTKINDSYFNTSTYNTPAWRRLVMCQEVGHTFGLDHQDEAFDNPNLGTCMDYTNDPDGSLLHQLSNEHPNAHDYEELASIYAHVDSSTTVKQTTASGALPPLNVDLDSVRHWGRLVKSSNGGRTETYELDLGQGQKLLTFVIWAL